MTERSSQQTKPPRTRPRTAPSGGRMKWRDLLSHARLGRGPATGATPYRTDFQRDFDRIVFSSAFRRLQDKAQVFPLAESDYVRTRLTHSLEASCIGRSLGTLAGEAILKREPVPGLTAADVGAIVAAACLAHDIGNPPFGHSGEDAIRDYFAGQPAVLEAMAPERRADFLQFEGNAQGFRVLTRLQAAENVGGMQLTVATLGAFTKYPCCAPVSAAAGGEGKASGRAGWKKHGFFAAEVDHFAEVAERTGLLPGTLPDTWVRHPLAFLVEAADDICYRIIDFEDGYRMGCIEYEEAHDALLTVITEPDARDRAAAIPDERSRIEFLRAKAIGTAVQQAATAWIERHDTLLAGEMTQELVAVMPCGAQLNALKRRALEKVYRSRPVLEIEAAGFEVIPGMMGRFLAAAEDVAARGKAASPRSRKLLELLPAQFLGPGGAPHPDPYTRTLQVTDYVSGMTDRYAVSTFKKLTGMSLPGS